MYAHKPNPALALFAAASRRADRLLAIGGALLLLAAALSSCATTAQRIARTEHATPACLTSTK